MAYHGFDKEKVEAVRKKYGVDIDTDTKWFECKKIWTDPDFEIYFGSNYDERIVRYVIETYQVNLNERSTKFWEHRELFKDVKYGRYFTELLAVGRREVFKIMNRRRPWSLDDSKKHHFFENIAENPTEATLYRQRNEFFIKGY
jgi:hypothetical protein